MPRDVSSSSSEDEADNLTTKSPEKPKQSEKPTRYQCPADFVSFCHKPCSSTLTESLKNNDNELWLIRAPANFDPECFSGIKVPLSGLKTLKVPAAAGGVQTGGSQQIYSVMASTHGTSELCLLTSDKHESDSNVFGPAFSGLLSVCENFGGSSASQAPQVIPATPAPSIPPGLKQRFHPFGSKTPTLTDVAESEVDGASLGPSSTPLCSSRGKRSVEEQEEDEGRKKKKKKKKEMETEMQTAQVVDCMQEIKVEPEADTQEEVMMCVEEKRKKKKKEMETETQTAQVVDYMQEIKVEPEADTQESEVVEEKRKKKKKKKDRERDEVEEGVTVKSEPIDTLYGDVEEGSGKKKKKKKKKSEDD